MPVLPEDECRRRMRRLVVIALGAFVAAVGLIAVIGCGALARSSENARMLLAFVLLCCGMIAGSALTAVLALWSQRVSVGRVRTNADRLERSTS